MIPRYAPTYTYSDIFNSISMESEDILQKELIDSLSNFFHVNHVFLTQSARVGLYAILKAYNRPGRVLMPAYNCIVVPEAVHYAGYQPEFIDINLNTLNVTPKDYEIAITPDTTAILATHLFGIPCELDEIMQIFKKREILIIEDAAPAFGAEYGFKKIGCFGDASVISFHSTKVVSGGIGGAVLVNNDALAEKIKKILLPAERIGNKWQLFLKSIAYKTALIPFLYTVIRYGYSKLHKELMYEIIPATLEQPVRYVSQMPGYACTLVQRQFGRLEWNLNRRRKIAQIYLDELANHDGWILPKVPESSSPSWIQFPMLCDNKIDFYKHMQSNGVDISWTYKYSCAESFGLDGFPNTQQAAKKIVSLPTTPYISDQQAYQICNKALKFLSHIR
jgi:dTDP-4-amino-4,6-dideoxygalactose transaminase